MAAIDAASGRCYQGRCLQSPGAVYCDTQLRELGSGGEEASETRPSTRGALSRRPRPTDNRPAVPLPEAGSPTAPRGTPSAVPHPFPLCPLGTGSPWARTRLQPPSALAGEGAPSPRGGQSPNAQGLPDRRQLSLLPERPFQLLAETCSEATSEDTMHRGQGRPASGGTARVMQSRVRHSRLLAVTQITFWHLWHRAPRRHEPLPLTSSVLSSGICFLLSCPSAWPWPPAARPP